MSDDTNDIDELLALFARMAMSTNGSLFKRRHNALTALVAERNGLRSALAGADIAKAALAIRIEKLESQGLTLPHDPPADRDRELRERLLESALQGAGCRLVVMKESDARELGRQAVWIVNGALAAMRKGADRAEPR